MDYAEIRNNPTSFLDITGVSTDHFDQMLPFFTDTHDEYFRWHDIKGKPISRRRSHVIQSNSPLASVAERLFFILSYLKNRPTQERHAAGFDMSQQQCGQWLRTLLEILRLTLDEAQTLPAETVNEFKKLLD